MRRELLIGTACCGVLLFAGCSEEPKVIEGTTTASVVVELTTTENTTVLAETTISESTVIETVIETAETTAPLSIEDIYTEEQLKKIEELISPKDYEKFLNITENGTVTIDENGLEKVITATLNGDTFTIEISVELIESIKHGEEVLFTAY